MPTATADKNQLMFTDIKYATVKKWGDYEEKVKWKLAQDAKNRGFILQIVKFTYDVRWVENNNLLTPEELFESQASWSTYSELWLISAGKNQPAATLNQDHFVFNSMEDTYGWIKEAGVACFFESNKDATDIGFAKNSDCPAGSFMFSKKGEYNPEAAVKTPVIEHLVHVAWDKNGNAKIVEEIPKP